MNRNHLTKHALALSLATLVCSISSCKHPKPPVVEEATEAIVITPTTTWEPYGCNHIDKRLGHKVPGFGVFRCVDSHPTNPDMVIIGGDTTGIWKSANRGESWKFVSKNLPFDQVYSLRFAPSNPNTVWAFTNKGAVISHDAGDSWAFTQLAIPTDLEGKMHGLLAISPKNDMVAIAYSDKKLYRTTDGGTTWTTTIPSILVRDLEFHPANPDIAYLAAGENGKGDSLSLMVSHDGGLTFKTTGQPLKFKNCHRASLAVSPAKPNAVWMMAFGSRKVTTPNGDKDAMFGGMFLSIDEGASLSPIEQPNAFKPEPDGMIASRDAWPIAEEKKGFNNKDDKSFMRMSLAQIGWDHALTVSDTDPNLIVAGGIGPIFSRDGGKSWEFGPPEGEGIHSDIQDAVLRGSRLWIVNDGGLNRVELANNKLVSYQVDGYNGQQCWGFGTSFKSGVAAFGINHSTIKVYDPKTYQGLYSAGGADAQTAFVNLFDDKWVYGTPWWNEVIRRPFTVDEKSPWRRSSIDFGYVPFRTPEPHPNLAYSFFALHKETDPANPHKTVAQQVARSDDNFHSLQTLWRMENTTARRLRVSITHPDTMIVISGPDKKVERSDDGGKSWSDITPKTVQGRYSDVAIDDSNPNTLWLSQSGYNTKQKILISKDGGQSWSDFSQGLDGSEAHTLCLQRSSNGLLYLGCRPGLWFRDLSMDAWKKYDDGLPFTRVSFLQIDYSVGKIRAGTNQGAWQANLAKPFAPQALIAASHQEVSPATSKVKFYCHSALLTKGASWQWSFPGGTPATSTQENPEVTYNPNSPNQYDVTLTVTNATGSSSTHTLPKFIHTGSSDDKLGKLKDVLLSIADPDARYGAENSKYLCRKLPDQSEENFNQAEAERVDAKRKARWDSFNDSGDDDSLRFERPEPNSY